MRPLRVGGSRLWHAAFGMGNWSLILAVITALVVGSVLTRTTLVTAQSLGQGQGVGQDPSFFPATGYRISSPAILNYFQRHGGVRSIGFPISSEFPLLGHRVQLFQRQMLELKADGSVGPINILDPDVLPITRMDGLALPPADPDMLGSAPIPANPDYLSQALSFVSVYVPDQWNDLPVNFQTTYLESVRCADAFGEQPCDPSQVAALALDLWGLPTSQPAVDPTNADFVYQRFQRGILHYSKATGLSQGLLVGDWFKRILAGMNLAPDLGSDVLGSRFYAQYVPTRPLGLSRPNDLPDTSLAQAFRADTLVAAGQSMQQPTQTLPPSVAETATAVAATATAITATQVALQGTQVALTTTAIAATSTAQAGQPTAAIAAQSVQSDIAVTNEGCLGDEQMWFVPRRPNLGTHVEIALTSRRHHDVRYVRLGGPMDPGVATERLGPLGFVWTWTIVPTVEAFHQWTFYADGLRPCITSGFNTFAPLGATATPTQTPISTNTPGATATPTNTPVPVPVIQSFDPPSGARSKTVGGTCSADNLSISGTNFGSTQGSVVIGPRTATNIQVWSNQTIVIEVPPGLSQNTVYTVRVINTGGGEGRGTYTIGGPPVC